MGINFDNYDAIRSKATPVNSIIILINIMVFAWLSLKGDPSDAQYMYEHGANYWPSVLYEHEYYRFITSAFMHFDLSHIFNNMIILAFIGDNLERALGKIKYLLFYLVTAVGSSAVSFWWDMSHQTNSVSAGASGAVFGVVGGILIVLVRNHGQLEDLNVRQIMIFAILSVYYGISTAGVDNAAHIGGFVIGALLALILYRKKPAANNPHYEDMTFTYQ